MDFEAFKNEVADRIKDFLPVDYIDSNILVQTVQKNNESLEAITISSPESNVSPTIYLNNFYEDYENGRDIEDILTDIANIRVEHEVDKDFDVTHITEYSRVKDKIAARMVGIEGNDALLDQRPHETMDDLAVTYCIMLGEDGNGSMSVPITNQLMDTWDVTQADLHALAKENLNVLTPSTFKPMSEVMAEMMIPQLMDDMGVDRTTAEQIIKDMIPPEDMMYVLSNEQKLNGAAALLDENMMAHITETLGDDFYILPSSIHETLIVSAKSGMELQDLESMVQEVNATQVAPQDRLSDHVYRYDFETHEVFRADRAEEHKLAKEAAKSEKKVTIADRMKAGKEKMNAQIPTHSNPAKAKETVIA